MSNYTPGTWTFHGSDDARIGDEIISSNGAPVLSGSIYNRADANLIASAPELLEALKDAIEIIEGTGLDASPQRAAIDKATGQEV